MRYHCSRARTQKTPSARCHSGLPWARKTPDRAKALSVRCHFSCAWAQKMPPRRAAIPAATGHEKTPSTRCHSGRDQAQKTLGVPPFPRPDAKKSTRRAAIPAAPGRKKTPSTRCHSGRARTQKNALGALPFRPRLAAFPGVLATVRSSPRVSPSAPKKHPGACPRAYWIAIQYAANGDLRRGFPAGAGLAERLHRVAPAGRLRGRAAPHSGGSAVFS